MTAIEKRLYSPNEAAAYLGVGRSTVYLLMDRGELRFINVGARRRLVREDLDQYVDRRLDDSAPALDEYLVAHTTPARPRR